MNKHFIFLGLLTLFSSASQAASFDCLKARSVPEKLICSDPELSNLDDQLAVIYRAAKARSTDKKAFAKQTADAWHYREKNCRDKECVKDWYFKRIAQLNPVLPAPVAPAVPAKAVAVSPTPLLDPTPAPPASVPPQSNVASRQDNADWYVANFAHTSCNPSHSPASRMKELIEMGLKAKATERSNGDIVDVAYETTTGETYWTFYRSYAMCESEMKPAG